MRKLSPMPSSVATPCRSSRKCKSVGCKCTPVLLCKALEVFENVGSSKQQAALESDNILTVYFVSRFRGDFGRVARMQNFVTLILCRSFLTKLLNFWKLQWNISLGCCVQPVDCSTILSVFFSRARTDARCWFKVVSVSNKNADQFDFGKSHDFPPVHYTQWTLWHEIITFALFI